MSAVPTGYLRRIVSGGQTGVDRSALDAALAAGFEHGGWCPRGRRAEDGRIPRRYCLRETRSPYYRIRTERNVLESDGTLILFRKVLLGGTELTYRLAQRHRKPCLLVDLADAVDPAVIQAWLEEHRIEVLNVAGPRESTAPGIGQQTYDLLCGLLKRR